MKVLAGDFKTNSANGASADFRFGMFSFPDPEVGFAWLPKLVHYKMSDVDELDEVSEENKVKVLGAAGWGTVGALALGPVGLLAGLVLGGRGKKVVFAVKFNDGKRALVEVNQKVWKKIAVERWSQQHESV